MDRRAFLRAAGAATTVALAGCATSRSATETVASVHPTTPSPTDTAAPTTEVPSTTTPTPTETPSTTTQASTETTPTNATTIADATTVPSAASTALPETTEAPTTVALTEAPTTSAPASLDELASLLQGRVVLPSDSDYDAVRFLQCTKFDGLRPAAIVVAQSASDAASSIAFARGQGMPFAVRSGGHSYGGWSSCPGLVIDVRGLMSVTVGSGGQTATIGAGAQLIDVYSTLIANGVAIAAGSCPTVGIAGLALGGGHGLTGRAFGLTCDQIRSVEIVTADGVTHTCDANTEPDLFWACRGGGGGSFGVVTNFTFDVHAVPSDATSYQLKYSWGNAAAALADWVAWAPTLPDATTSLARLEGTPQLVVAGLHLGTVAEANALLAPMIGSASSHSVVRHDYIDAVMSEAGCSHTSVAACHAGDTTPGGTLPRPTPFAATSHYFTDPLSSDAIQTAITAIDGHKGATGGSKAGTIQFDLYGGAIGRVPPDATAFVHRGAFCSAQYASFYSTGAGDHDRAWLKLTRAAMEPFSNGEAYQNYADPDLDDWAMAYYGANLTRLQQVKARYDPTNAFSFAQSIPLP